MEVTVALKISQMLIAMCANALIPITTKTHTHIKDLDINYSRTVVDLIVTHQVTKSEMIFFGTWS